MSPSRHIALLLAALLLETPAASAYSIMSSFTYGCHEGLTLTAYFQTRDVLFKDGLPVNPPDGVWEQVADYLFSELEVDEEQLPRAGERFALFSLLVGVRAPDSEGFSTTNLDTLRAIHAAPKGQYDHCLRAPDDDYDEGNIHAWKECNAVLDRQMESAKNYLEMKRPQDQNKQVSFSLDFYGAFNVDVWGPAYHLGRAVHLLQDSFSHTVRTADLRQIVHVMNFADAVGGVLEVERDGLPHSRFTDRCDQEVRQSVFAAIEASADLLRAACESFDPDKMRPGTYIARAVVGKWMEMSEEAKRGECTLENDFCDSPWTANAKKDPEKPLLGSCSSVGAGMARGGPRAPVLFLLLVLFVIRRRRRR